MEELDFVGASDCFEFELLVGGRGGCSSRPARRDAGTSWKETFCEEVGRDMMPRIECRKRCSDGHRRRVRGDRKGLNGLLKRDK